MLGASAKNCGVTRKDLMRKVLQLENTKTPLKTVDKTQSVLKVGPPHITPTVSTSQDKQTARGA